MSEENSQYVTRAGAYIATVEKPTNGWFGEAGENQTPYIRIPVRVSEQRDGKNDQIGRVITWQGWLTDAAFDRTIKALCEAFPEWDGDLESLSRGEFSFAGGECQIVAESENYEGKPRIKAKWLNPVGGGGKPMDAAKVSSLVGKLSQRAKAVAKTVRSESGAPAPRSSRPAAPEPEDDDIPF